MIVWNVSKLNFLNYEKRFYHWEVGMPPKPKCTFIEIRDIWGKLIYRIERKDNDLIMNGYTFSGHFDSLKIHRNTDISVRSLTNTFKVELFCKDCQDTVYRLTGKLPLLIKIKTDFHVTKDTR